MKHVTVAKTPVGLRVALAGLGLIAGLMMFQPGEIQASVSGGAQIYNQATVTYSTPTIPSKKAWGSATVIVATKANNPFVTVTSTAQTTGEGSTVNYTYNIINLSNGRNDLSVTSPLTSADFQVNAPATNSLAALPVLTNMWGGIALDIPADNSVKVPAGTLTGLADGTAIAVKVGLNVYYYTVASTDNGILASTNAAGDLIAETNATLTLTPVAYAGVAATPLNAALVGGTAAGTIIGEYRPVVQTLTTTTIIAPNTSGRHTINITVTATDGTTSPTYTTIPGNNNQTITTVVGNPLSVVKSSALVTPPGAVPGAEITYTVLITNNTSAATTAASIADPLSSYVTYVANSTTLNGVAVADNVGPFVAPKTAFPYSDTGKSINGPGQAVGVIVPGATVLEQAKIVYKVKIN